VRARALILVGCLCWASSAFAQGQSDFEKARIAYLKKDYVEADARFAAMLDPKTGTVKTPALVNEAEFAWGATKYAQGDVTGAHKHWERVIRDTMGTYSPDVLTYPANVINDFLSERDHVNSVLLQEQKQEAERAAAERKRAAEERARLQARVKELEKLTTEETVVVHASRLVALLPFGIGQFQNRKNGLGWFFLLTESAAVLTTVVLLFPYRWNVDQWNAVLSDPTSGMTRHDRAALADQYAAVAQNIRTADFITLGALGALAVAGIIEAEVAFKPQFSFTRKRKVAAIWPSLAPVAGGAFVGLGGRF
jgi:hypothetical protein